jgi:apocytochrome f
VFKKFKSSFTVIGILAIAFFSQISFGYPIFSQQAYQNPREPTGAIACANCHLAGKSVELEVPRAVLPDTVFEAVVSIPYDPLVTGIQGNNKRGSLYVGSVLILPEGFRLAPKNRLSGDIKARTAGSFIQPYSKERKNILVVGPNMCTAECSKSEKIIFPVLSPDPSTNKDGAFLNYPVSVGGVCGRGQLYPTGEKSNNADYTSSVGGQVKAISPSKEGKIEVDIITKNGNVIQTIPPGFDLKVKVKETVESEQPLAIGLSTGGYGQSEGLIVLQKMSRVVAVIGFFFTVVVTQILLVIKKKQFSSI